MIKKFLFFLVISCSFLLGNKISNQKVLLNAESFGFGPSAAIAQIFTYLRDHINHISYIGTGHTLDLQNKLPYNAIYNYEEPDIATQKNNFSEIVKNYDVFITATDFQAAQWAKELGLKVIIYDPLTWYWSNIPPIIKKADLYISQNFLGVAQRLKSTAFPTKSVLIPPIVKIPPSKIETDHILVNTGGLFNPFIEQKNLLDFAHILFNSIDDILKNYDQHIDYVSNQAIARSISTIPIKTMQPSEIQVTLNNAQFAIMTPGLGNIYEAAAMKKYVIWLPPANDSQGQQIQLLRDNNISDYAIDWHEILDNQNPIDYRKPQEEVLIQISHCIQRLSCEKKAQKKFKELVYKYIIDIKCNLNKKPSLTKLIDLFGENGTQIAAHKILEALHDF
ncbi:TPA: hypothetical protein DIC20_01000 [Candidatus Dependentiae bacterium]|nr:MAG: hypothetical protein US03_C0002G0190 [candidate division TM6 bacterium GW2011_GWF2_36_131]KKQ03623.1 MAG: hypothetical protein US13_C0002G0189 [candidate division TM6 bacterium GW2011_GWE2_36_25]KKQ18067.1 MAG: hypothetical protein US32_C0032G0005 [candidate division TM6 bacterium GW2011_GWA2_36_9]HBR70645.1 hypothetical protein [Candidatus Dependentiae bacterium]HCU00265.1 hypothetical protein [Candidatus Dependentiae bacterium]